MKKIILLLTLGFTTVAGVAQTSTNLYQQNWGSGVAPNNSTVDTLGWTAIHTPSGGAGTWAAPGAVDAVSGDPLPDNYIYFGGDAGVGVVYTSVGAGSGTYGNSSFTSIDPTVHTNLEMSVHCRWDWQGSLTTDYFAVLVGGNWYVSTNHPLSPPSASGANLFYKVAMTYNPNATNWNTLTLSDPAVIGPQAGANLSGTIDGVGIVAVRTGGSWWHYNVLRISSISSNAPPEPPQWQAGPLSAENYAGAGVSFGVKTSSTLPVSYQWLSNGVALVDGGRISGATNSVLSIANVNTGDSGAVYSVIVSNVVGGFNTSTNSPATLTVNPLPGDYLYSELFPYVGPTLVAGPVSLVGWSNSIPDSPNRLSQRSGGDGLAWNFEGFAWTSAFYTTTTSDTGASGLPFPSINPEAHPAVSLVVDLEPGWQAYNVSGVYFAVQMGGADWFVSQTPLPVDPNASGFTTYQQGFNRGAIHWQTLTLNAASATIGVQPASNLSGNITGVGLVFVNSGAGTINFDNIAITTTAAPDIAPFVIYPPIPQTAHAGGGASFAVKSGGTAPLTYYWQRNQVTLNDGGRFSGTRSNVMTIQNVNTNDEAIYSVIVSNAAGTADSINLSISGLTVTSLPTNVLYAEAFPYVGPVPSANYPLDAVDWASAVPNNPNRLYAQNYAGSGAAFSFEGSGSPTTAHYTDSAMDTGASGLAFPAISLNSYGNISLSVGLAPTYNPANVTAYFAVQLNNGSWAVSANALPVPAVATNAFTTFNQAFNPAASGWNTLTLNGTGATIGATVPANLTGTITGAGLVFSFTGDGGNFDFDNFQITGSPATNPGSITVGATTATTLTLNWTANPNVHLQSATNLVPPAVWSDVPGTAGQGSAIVNTTGPQMFFRLIGQ